MSQTFWWTNFAGIFLGAFSGPYRRQIFRCNVNRVLFSLAELRHSHPPANAIAQVVGFTTWFAMCQLDTGLLCKLYRFYKISVVLLYSLSILLWPTFSTYLVPISIWRSDYSDCMPHAPSCFSSASFLKSSGWNAMSPFLNSLFLRFYIYSTILC